MKVWAGAAGDGPQEESAAFSPRVRTEGASSEIRAGPPPQVQCKLPLRAVEISCPRVFGEVGRSPQEGEAADIASS